MKQDTRKREEDINRLRYLSVNARRQRDFYHATPRRQPSPASFRARLPLPAPRPPVAFIARRLYIDYAEGAIKSLRVGFKRISPRARRIWLRHKILIFSRATPRNGILYSASIDDASIFILERTTIGMPV